MFVLIRSEALFASVAWTLFFFKYFALVTMLEAVMLINYPHVAALSWLPFPIRLVTVPPESHRDWKGTTRKP